MTEKRYLEKVLTLGREMSILINARLRAPRSSKRSVPRQLNNLKDRNQTLVNSFNKQKVYFLLTRV